MRHLGKVCEDGLAADVHAEPHRELRFCCEEFLVLEYFTQLHALEFRVRHFDADGRLAGDGLDAHGGRSEAQSQVIGKVRDLADLDAGGRLEFVARDGWAVAGVDDLGLDMEILERLLQDARLVFNLDFKCRIVAFNVLRKDLGDTRQHVGPRSRLLCRSSPGMRCRAVARAVEQGSGRHDWRNLIVGRHRHRFFFMGFGEGGTTGCVCGTSSGCTGSPGAVCDSPLPAA